MPDVEQLESNLWKQWHRISMDNLVQHSRFQQSATDKSLHELQYQTIFALIYNSKTDTRTTTFYITIFEGMLQAKSKTVPSGSMRYLTPRDLPVCLNEKIIKKLFK